MGAEEEIIGNLRKKKKKEGNASLKERTKLSGFLSQNTCMMVISFTSIASPTKNSKFILHHRNSPILSNQKPNFHKNFRYLGKQTFLIKCVFYLHNQKGNMPLITYEEKSYLTQVSPWLCQISYWSGAIPRAGMFKSLFYSRSVVRFKIKSPNCLPLLCLGLTTQNSHKNHELDAFTIKLVQKFNFRNTPNVTQIWGRDIARVVLL